MQSFMTLPRESWDIHGILLAERKWLFERFGWDVVPHGLRALAQRLIEHGTATGEPRARATRWIRATGSDVVDVSRGGRADVLLLLDGHAPYDRTLWPALAAAVRLLRAAGLTVGTLGASEIATAAPVLAAGDVQESTPHQPIHPEDGAGFRGQRVSRPGQHRPSLVPDGRPSQLGGDHALEERLLVDGDEHHLGAGRSREDRREHDGIAAGGRAIDADADQVRRGRRCRAVLGSPARGIRDVR